jgi:hypothetical protein
MQTKFKIVQQKDYKEILIHNHRDLAPVIKEVILSTEDFVKYIISEDRESLINNLLEDDF